MVGADDAGRRRLYDGLIERLGGDVADALMAYLPHSGWPDFATKQDVAMSAAQLRAEMSDMKGGLRAEISEMKAELRAEMSKQTRTIVLAIVTMMVATVGSFTAAVVTVAH
jgi:hypothetical protein